MRPDRQSACSLSDLDGTTFWYPSENDSSRSIIVMPATSSIFSFHTGPTTVLASLLYLAIFTSVYITQYGPSVPSLQRRPALGFNLGHAYQDLHRVSFPGHAVYGIHHFTPPNRLRSVHIPTTLVKMTSCAISCWNGYEK